MRRSIFCAFYVTCCLATAISWADDEGAPPLAETDPNSNQIRFFESRVRPILVAHCYECHGADEQESGLRLDSYAAILRGGDSGPAVVPGEPKGSLLVTAITYQDSDLQMPPDGKLSDQQIADLTRWVEVGAPYPNARPINVAEKGELDLEKERQFWAFTAPSLTSIPEVQDTAWPSATLDFFVLAKLEENGLKPVAAVDKRTLIRRATFDLVGLPPTPDEIEEFLADDSPDAFAKVVDRLLASPRYGERWGRHWLDVARYADSNGLDENIAHGNAWRYRDYVIAALNKDKPYDQFLCEQLAGDLLPTDDEKIQHERLIATGFLSLGPKVLAEVDEMKMEMDIVDEQIDTVGRALMGLTLGCARCHDHKFDPITQHDYYALAGIFKSTKTMESFTKIARWNENEIATAADVARKAAHEKQVAEHKANIDSFIQKANEQLKAAAEPGFKLPDNPETLYPDETKTELKKLRDELAALEKSAPEMPTAMGVTDGTVANVAVHIRGSHLTLGQVMPRRFPEVLLNRTEEQIEADRSGRLRLAQWLGSEDHPLASRVMVNRIWRWHFGRGLIASADNFGHLGDRPLNQPLLDWLALRFIESGWSIKDLHRLIMLSSTYQMSSDYDEQNARIDPENRHQWRTNVRRLEAEAIRDSLLAVSGTLDTSMGGSLLHVPNREFIFNHTSKDETTYDSQRRSIYLPIIRNHLYDVFQLFDCTDAAVPSGDRSSSTVAPQALFMMNSELVIEATEKLAAKLLEDETASNEERVARLYKAAYGRPATEEETKRALRFITLFAQTQGNEDADPVKRSHAAWAALCQVTCAANEFVYLR